jgi:hypothetical protein
VHADTTTHHHHHHHTLLSDEKKKKSAGAALQQKTIFFEKERVVKTSQALESTVLHAQFVHHSVSSFLVLSLIPSDKTLFCFTKSYEA